MANIGQTIVTQSKSKTIITRSMLTISLIVFTDPIQGHVHICHRIHHMKIGLILINKGISLIPFNTLLFNCYSCCLVKAGAGDLFFLIFD